MHIRKLNRKCWASILGGCSSKMSKEHVISRSVNRALNLGAMLNNPKKWVGAEKLKLGILCNRHNSLLSELDQEAGKFAQTITNFFKNSPGKLANLSAPYEQRLQIDGEKIERWAIKTFLNNAVMQGCFPTRLRSGPVSGRNIVEYVFGKAPLPEHSGLYIYYGKPTLPLLAPKSIFNLQIMSSECRFYRFGASKWDEKFRMPIFMRMDLLGYKFAVSANIAGVSDNEWQNIVTKIHDHPSKSASLHPPQLGYNFSDIQSPIKSATLWVDIGWKTATTPSTPPDRLQSSGGPDTEVILSAGPAGRGVLEYSEFVFPHM